MTYYEILGVDEQATQEQIKAAYRTLVKKYHPDVNHAPNAEAFFRLIQEAYQCLSNVTDRQKYDEWIKHSSSDSSNENFEYRENQKNNNDDFNGYESENDAFTEERYQYLKNWYNTYVKFRFQQHNPFVKFLLIFSRVILAPLVPILIIVWGIFKIITAISRVLSWIICIGSIVYIGYMAIHDRFSYQGEWILGLCFLGVAIATYWLPHILNWLIDRFAYLVYDFKQFISQIGILLFKKVPDGWTP